MFQVVVPIDNNVHGALDEGFGSNNKVLAMCREHIRRLNEAHWIGADDPTILPLDVRSVWIDGFLWTGLIAFTFANREAWDAFAYFAHQCCNTEIHRSNPDGVVSTVYSWETQLWELDVHRAQYPSEPGLGGTN